MKDFREAVAAAESVSELEPVFVVEDGEPRKVLVDIAEYRRMGGVGAEKVGAENKDTRPLSESLAMPDGDGEYFEWEPPRLGMYLTEDTD